MGYVAEKIRANNTKSIENEKLRVEKMQKKWLKKNKVKKCPDAYMDNPYIQKSSSQRIY